jgi:integrating conjugative element protein (TIGR03757 family)
LLCKALSHAYEGLVKAQQYRLDRLPAIVFDNGQAVVYGVTDLEAALSHYRQWRRAQGRE